MDVSTQQGSTCTTRGAGPPKGFVQLGIRPVWADCDQRLDDLVDRLLRDGVRVSKADLGERLLFGLLGEPNKDLQACMGAFRR